MSDEKFQSLLDKKWQISEEREAGCFYVWERKIKGKRNRAEILVTPTSEVYTWLGKADVLKFSEYIDKQLKKLPLFEFVDESSAQEFKRYNKLSIYASRFSSINKSISRKATEEKANELIESWITFLWDFYKNENRQLRRRFYKYITAREKRSQHERVVNHPDFNDALRQRKRAAKDNPLPKALSKTNAYQQVAKLKSSKHPDLIKMRVEYDRANQTLYLAAKNSKQISMRFDDLEEFNNYFEKPRVVSGLSEDEQAAVDTHKRLASDIIKMVEGGIADEKLALKWIALYKHWDKNKTRFRKALDAIRKYANG